MPERSPSRLPALILASAVLGIVLGLAVGERAAVLRPLGIAYLDLWLSLEVNLGIRDAETRYWIRGEPRPAPTRRWSLLDDVLGWGSAAAARNP